MTPQMQKIMSIFVVVILILIIMGLLIIRWDDGQVVIIPIEGTETLAIIAMAIVAIFGFINSSIQTGNFADGYGKLIDKLTSDDVLLDTLERNYVAMPDGLPKKAIDLFAEMAKHIVNMTPNEADDKMAKWVDDLRDGKPNIQNE